MGGLGPMAGQNHHFGNYAPEKIPYAIDRYVKETNRLYGVLDKRLADREFVAGDYSIADMACYPWIVPYERQGQKLEDFPHLKRWFEAIAARPAVDARLREAKAVDPNPPASGRGGEQAPVRPVRGIGRQCDALSRPAGAAQGAPARDQRPGRHGRHPVLGPVHLYADRRRGRARAAKRAHEPAHA